ncbi:hypothetical protein SAMN05892883_1616 [Jatrophihabitans sp. GAS493]|uniref:hypothetical protein n=1 Tax=Jatrophihabitans sp. GAS493 TaxID=1907575 RepID=UPI000BB8A6FA|nr:hypothetical protein [Jatrophihabitans sp. GAS493]SOD72196.1 hypothetical protein SAMN05892883_1616 [Jatrophihabitans sp. GAS493]
MNQWINLHALWQILILGMICGAGLPALFALGLRALSATGGHADDSRTDRIVGGSAVGIATAVVCFAVVIVAIGWGLYLIVSSS